jgi:hypothetical protein
MAATIAEFAGLAAKVYFSAAANTFAGAAAKRRPTPLRIAGDPAA